MALLSDGGTMFQTSYLGSGTTLPNATFFAWYRAVGNAQTTQGLLVFAGQAPGAVTGQYSTGILHAGSSNTFTASNIADGAGTSQEFSSISAAGTSAGNWYPILGTIVMGKQTTITSTLGNNTGSSGTLGAQTWDHIQFMGRQQNGAGSPSAFCITGTALAELAIWDCILTPNEQAELVSFKKSPWQINNSHLFMYCPLRGDIKDYGPNHFNFLPSGTGGMSFGTDHPIWPTSFPGKLSRAPYFSAAITSAIIGSNASFPLPKIVGNLKTGEALSANATFPRPVVNANLKTGEAISANAKFLRPAIGVNLATGEALSATVKFTRPKIAANLGMGENLTAAAKFPRPKIGSDLKTGEAISANALFPRPRIGSSLSQGTAIQVGAKFPLPRINGHLNLPVTIASAAKFVRPVVNANLGIGENITAAAKFAKPVIAGNLVTGGVNLGSGAKFPRPKIGALLGLGATIAANSKFRLPKVTAVLTLSDNITANAKFPKPTISANLLLATVLTAASKFPLPIIASTLTASSPPPPVPPGPLFTAERVGMVGPNVAGINLLSEGKTYKFTCHIRKVLPLDGYVYWVATRSIQVAGSLHIDQNKRQLEDENLAVNRMVLTTQYEVQQFNQIGPDHIWVGEADGVQFAFSRSGPTYKQAGLYHYAGDALFPSMSTQLVSSDTDLSGLEPIVSNSLPAWLALVEYNPIWISSQIPNPFVTLYPSFLSPANLRPPYGTVHIYPDSIEAIQAFPRLYRVHTSQEQLASERVRVTLYGLTNAQVENFVNLVNQYSEDTNVIGMLDISIVRDVQKTQAELGIIGMKKTIDYKISYNQGTIRTVARALIEHASATVISSTVPYGVS